jgi:hypothetical protein
MGMLALALTLTLPVGSFAYDRAAEVLANCSANPNSGAEEVLRKVHCSGYLTGIIDGVLMMQSAAPGQRRYICPPNDVSGEQTLQAVIRWLQQNPRRANDSARVAV